MLDGPTDVAKLVAFLSMEVKMPIASLLRGNPTLWHALSNWMNGHLSSMTKIPDEELYEGVPSLEEDMPMVPINKLGQYFESNDFNAIIPITYHHRKVEAILDGGEGVSTMTKQCWEKWGRPPMEKTSSMVKLANGDATRLVGVVKDLKIKAFRITYHVWFVVMDFRNPIDS